jgi:signal recognition particle subunit SEC65
MLAKTDSFKSSAAAKATELKEYRQGFRAKLRATQRLSAVDLFKAAIFYSADDLSPSPAVQHDVEVNHRLRWIFFKAAKSPKPTQIKAHLRSLGFNIKALHDICYLGGNIGFLVTDNSAYHLIARLKIVGLHPKTFDPRIPRESSSEAEKSAGKKFVVYVRTMLTRDYYNKRAADFYLAIIQASSQRLKNLVASKGVDFNTPPPKRNPPQKLIKKNTVILAHVVSSCTSHDDSENNPSMNDAPSESEPTRNNVACDSAGKKVGTISVFGSADE